MKPLLLFILSFLISTASAQFADEVNHCIFFLKPGDYHLRKISEGDNSIISTKSSGKQLAGLIRKISGDTLFINDTLIRAGDITYFSFNDELKSPILLTRPSDLPKRLVLFAHDTMVWKTIIPPREIFSSIWMYKTYVKRIQDSAKRTEQRRRMENLFRSGK